MEEKRWLETATVHALHVEDSFNPAYATTPTAARGVTMSTKLGIALKTTRCGPKIETERI